MIIIIIPFFSLTKTYSKNQYDNHHHKNNLKWTTNALLIRIIIFFFIWKFIFNTNITFWHNFFYVISSTINLTRDFPGFISSINKNKLKKVLLLFKSFFVDVYVLRMKRIFLVDVKRLSKTQWERGEWEMYYFN